ncbi:chitobiase/beta-hexosaminidase C-terminal domain-containing protein [bacterium]|nr:chitobiase/beta-hexosaminidase C-terminal domain-containing protein [bacterium]MBP9808359.1 chitobiase/beta-hexosaminidase C-terminal domain-containing protein [bacterium]
MTKAFSILPLNLALALSLASALPSFATSPPVITPPSGTYSTVQPTVTITGDPGANFFFTTNGSVPSVLSTPYSGPVSIGKTATIKAIADLSGVQSTVTTANIQSDPSSLPVPRTGLSLWLKSEFGPLLSGSNITQWHDLSGAAPANNATQATGSKQATLVSPAINGYPSASFNGSSRNYVLANQLTDLTTGFSIFAVVKPIGTATKTFIAFSNAGPSNLVSLETLNTQVRLNAYNATTASNVITPTSSITVGKFQLVDAVHNGAASASISVNGESKISGTVQNLVNTARTQNILGANNTIATYWNGELAELLCYSRAVTETERKNIQAYFFNKFQLTTATATAAPVFSVGTSTLTEPTEVAIAVPYNGIGYFTTTGVNPTTSSPVYSKPVRINYTQTLKCLIVANGINSSITTANFTLNSAKWPAPDPLDTRPLQINLQLPTTAIPQ